MSRSSHLHDNEVFGHFGIHSSGVNLYEGCRDILFERNHVEKSVVINRSAEDFVIRNNLFDGLGETGYLLAFWPTGRVGGTHISNMLIEHNTFVNTDPRVEWGCSILGQGGSPVTGLVVRNNILERLGGNLSGNIRNNLFTRPRDADKSRGGDNITASGPEAVFRDPANNDFRLRPDSPAIGAGAPGEVKDDLRGNPRDPNRVDIGAFAAGD